MPLPARLSIAAAAGAMAGAAFEPVGWVYLLPVAVAVLSLACVRTGVGTGLLVGATFGTVFLLVLLPWLQVIGWDAWIVLALVEGLFYGLVGGGTVAVMRLRWWPVWAACLWVGVELLRSSLPFGGFPWGRLAFATVDTPAAPLFALTGPAGATFAVALVGTSLAWALLHLRRAPAQAVAAVGVAALLASAGSLGALQGEAAAQRSATVRIAAVQGDVPGSGMNPFAERRVVLDNHVRATQELAARVRSGAQQRPDLVIWPENSTDIDPFSDPTVYADIQAAVDAIDVPVLVGAMVDGPAPDEVLNQGIVWQPSTGPSQRYTKRHPVPFGEYIPFRNVIAKYFTRLDQVPRDMRPGAAPGVLHMDGTRIGDVICFEVAYDGLLRDVVRAGGQVLVVQTNNATYMGTGQVEQQFAIARLRAIETHRYVVVAATNGVSGIVDPDGDVVLRAPVRSQDVLLASVTRHDDLTMAVRFGAWVEGVLSLVGAVAVAVALLGGRRRPRAPEPRWTRTPERVA